ncbi:hypothetical protein PYW07_013067 [Mythimna separata]|uniref:Uncharacterized protein n=1 Tax=Mythimna separata TaxID=271217 RepID=A0AAD7Y5T1_MYTSE|nr:hypothetical protein PYW07_013067 [Mythimna separata]
MIVFLFLFCAVISSDVYTVAQLTTLCSTHEHNCVDGSCVRFSALCDGKNDCPDGGDELGCDKNTTETLAPVSANSFFSQLTNALDRHESVTELRKDQWQCPDGTRISVSNKCDGRVDCPDRSDETHALCGENECNPNEFRCTYGACVVGTAPCNDFIDCADQSDELLPSCRNGTDEIQYQFTCRDGSNITASVLCDGKSDCPDGSDETLRACSAKTCASNQFQCAYGACVAEGSDCNGKQDCPDGSDESDELCNRQLATSHCILPPYPEHGTYVSNQLNATPGQAFESLYVKVFCHEGYGVLETDVVFCHEGSWSHSVPECVRMCKLNSDPSVHYYCPIPDTDEDHRDCKSYEPEGTVVKPECNSPNYYSTVTLSLMTCINGSWDYVAVCKPECGRVTPDGVALIIDGRHAKRGELPWHVGIYRKTTDPYTQICGGSLVTNRVVISAAHCFWNDVIKQQPASMFAVAVGKLYRPWNNERDVDAQKSDVKEIKLPLRFQGSAANFQDDIAVIILETAFEYKTYIRPVCLDFDIDLDSRQLQPGMMGKVAGWGLIAEDGEASRILKVVELPYVDITRCIRSSPLSFREYITSDKICSGYGNGTALCKGDSGGGLAFLESERYYLRGIVSTAPNNEHLCNSNTLTTFTQIIKHEHFLKKHI